MWGVAVWCRARVADSVCCGKAQRREHLLADLQRRDKAQRCKRPLADLQRRNKAQRREEPCKLPLKGRCWNTARWCQNRVSDVSCRISAQRLVDLQRRNKAQWCQNRVVA